VSSPSPRIFTARPSSSNAVEIESRLMTAPLSSPLNGATCRRNP
jgi:hypothetical protein